MSEKNKLFTNLTLLIMLLPILLTSCLTTKNIKKTPIFAKSKILDFGIVDENEIQYFPWKDDNEKEAVKEFPKFIQTKVVPAKIGSGFGIVYVIDAVSMKKELKILVKVTHPLIKGKTSYESIKMVKLGQPNCFYFKFEDESEVVEGNFNFQILYKKEVILHKKFTACKPT
jgi:hypothetical protein